jgi:protein arginine kinase
MNAPGSCATKFNGSKTKGTEAVQLDDLATGSGEWLRGAGPESDIVISSRIRLARNLADFPFISRATPQDRTRIEKILHERIPAVAAETEVLYVNLSQLDQVDRQFLVERHLISREHAEAKGDRAVAIDSHEKFSLMINEEDHLRIQVMQSGLELSSVWEQINRIDDLIEEKVTYAFHERLGYLTACPTNVGTGMRVSVMLHLPALVITRQIDKVFRSLQKISLTVRGLYGEGSQAMGDFYQISNQVTLGRTETDLVRQVSDIVPVIVDYERQAREFLVKESHENLHDRVSRAYGILRTAQTISSEETMHLLSSVRMGVNLGLIRDVNIPAVNELFLRTQPAHLQKLTGGELDTSDRNIERARYLRRYLNRETNDDNGGAEKN